MLGLSADRFFEMRLPAVENIREFEFREMLDDSRDLTAQRDPQGLAQVFDLLGKVRPVELLIGASARGRARRVCLLQGPNDKILVVKALRVGHSYSRGMYRSPMSYK